MTTKIKISYKPLAVALSLVLFLFLLPAQVHAGIITSISSSATHLVVGEILNLIRSILGGVIAFLGSWVDYVIRQPVTGSTVVQNSWELTRNFANMFFIIALIIMAFATIFNVSRYNFSSLVVNFIIAALLINFSLVIGEVIIDWSQSLSNVFLQAMGDVGARIGEGAKLGSQFDGATTPIPTDVSIWQLAIGAFANIILLSMVAFSLIVLMFFAIVRIPVLWFLLILSPLAWILYILPTTRKYNQMWWDYFISWNLFMPIYLFFIYFGILFLNNQTQILGQPVGGVGIVPGIPGSTTIQTLFFYTFIGIIFIYGAKIAMGFSRAGGAGAVAGWGQAKGMAMARWGRRLPGRGVGLAWRATGAEDVYKDAKKTFQEKGFAGFEKTENTILSKGLGIIPGYRGKQGREEASVWLNQQVKDITGIDLAPGLAEKQFTKNVDATTQKMKERRISENPTQLETLITSGTPEEKIAASKLLKEFHVEELSVGQIEEIYNTYTSQGLTTQASKFLSGVNYKKLSPTDLRLLQALPVNPAYQRQFQERIADALVEKGAFQDRDDYVALMTRYPTNDAMISAIKKSKDFRNSLGKVDRQWIFDQFTGNKEVQRALAEQMLEKGDFDETRLRAMTNLATGIYDTDLQRDQALNAAKDSEFMAAIQLQRELGLLKDSAGNPLYGSIAAQRARNTPADIEADVRNAIREQGKRKNITQILKMSTSTLSNPIFQEEMEPNLDIGAIEAMPNSQEYTPAKGVALENLTEMIRQRSFVAEKINPLTENISKLRALVPAIIAAPDERALSVLEQQSRAISAKIRSLVKDINDTKFADQGRKDEANNDSSQVLADLDQALKTTKERFKPPKGPRTGGTP